MLFTCKNFMFSDLRGKKFFCSRKWCGGEEEEEGGWVCISLGGKNLFSACYRDVGRKTY